MLCLSKVSVYFRVPLIQLFLLLFLSGKYTSVNDIYK